MELNVNRLSTVIDAVTTRHFYPKLLAFLASYFSFDSAIIFAFEHGQPPRCLLKTGSHEDDDINRLYQGGAYLQDPFYRAFNPRHDTRVCTLGQLAPDGFYCSDYYRDFYHKTGWQDEVGVLLQLPGDRALGLFFGSLRQQVRKYAGEPESLSAFLRVLKSLIRLHADVSPLSAGKNVTVEAAAAEALSAGLTPREREIVSLILAGKSSQQIAEQIYISTGTVKNHRKNIYGKLNIRSQAELFSRFLMPSRLP